MNDKKTDEYLKNKKIMRNMMLLMLVSMLFYLGIVALSAYIFGESTIFGIIVCIATIIMICIAFYSLKVEVSTGYYECKKCHHRFTTGYFKAAIAPHIYTTRYLKCPKCNKKTWARKVMTKE